MANKRIWTEDEIADICARYEAGQTRIAIAKVYQTKPARIRELLREHNIPLRTGAGRSLHKYTPDIEAKIVARYLAGEPLETIQQTYHMQYITFRRMVARHGGQMRRRGPLRKWTPEELERIKQMIEAGESRHAIAVALHAAPATLVQVIRAHHLDEPRSGVARGKYAGGWTGGRSLNSSGYIQVFIPLDHPMAAYRRIDGYALEHRLVMAEHLGRPLRPNETVHHINGDKTDNRIENLQLRQGKHGNGVVYVCLNCGSHNVKPGRLLTHEE